MAISTDYPRPITVNGFVCRNCDDVSDAKKFIDPSKSKAAAEAGDAGTAVPSAVSFGGSLSSRNIAANAVSPLAPSEPGQRYDKVA